MPACQVFVVVKLQISWPLASAFFFLIPFLATGCHWSDACHMFDAMQPARMIWRKNWKGRWTTSSQFFFFFLRVD